MSTPSSHNDGPTTGRAEFFGHGLSPNLVASSTQLQQQQLQQQQQHNLPLQQQSFINSNSNIALQQQTAVIQQQAATNPTPAATTLTAPPTQFVHWSNPLMGGAAFMQPQPQPTPAAAPQQQQQQQFNDFLFNIQAQAAYAAAAATVPPTPVATSASPQETYSVLRVGNGNFLKIYHCPENAMGPLPGETSFAPMSQYNQGQATTFHHVNAQGGAAGPASLQQQQSQSQLSGSANSTNPQVFNSYELFSSNTFTQLPTAEMPPLLLLGPTSKPPTMNTTEDIISHSETNQGNNTETTNVIIHNMPNNSNNWTTVGGNHPAAAPLYAQFENCASNQEQLEALTHSLAGPELALTNNNSSSNDATLEKTLNAHIAIQQQQQPQLNLNPSMSPENIKQTLSTSSSSAATAAALLPSSSSIKTEIPRQEAPKKRIVAEVKPMRMTYSDVLSKFNNQSQNSQQNNLNNLSMTTTSTAANSTNQRSQQKSLKNESNNANNSSINLRRLADDTTVPRSSSKKSPTHENKENQQQQQHQMINNKLNNNNNQKRSTANTTTTLNGNNNIAGISSNKSATTIQKNLINNSKNNTFNINNNNGNNSSNNNNNDNQQSKKLRSNKNSDIQNNGAKNYGNNNDQRGTFKTSGTNAPNNSTQSTNVYNNTNNTYARKPTKSSNSGNSSSAIGQQRSRYQNNSNASYSYSSTKRSRNNSSYGASSSLNSSSYANGAGNNRNYELAKRFLQAWYTYTLKILTWLFYLVYDIVVLGCSILYERLLYAYECGKMYAKQLHKDLKQNSNKPGIWFKNYCRKFDAKFSKTSKWAFWRRFYKKKPPEASSEAIKTGRLPATGEEAMYQLLNCKGKDAYSILGVPPNSSQEQIRKHYKKIAVLVHPDKNKQAGAEEAFKVLQRAFELIGEPENRLAYDQSLAEALHAEKAWTELHDLLSQLQTKITEAANTIRCSTCGLRHPRKITDRPHYAARECASCKIRHSAREGDIWAETSMLGLRWKYLALMEGKVYDITEWANCQKGALAHLEPNSHMVQYRIVRGAQQQQQQQQNQQKQQAQQQQQQQHHHQQHHTGSQYPGAGGMGGKFKRDNIPTSEASLHEFLDNLYSGQHPQQQQQNTSAYAGSSRRRNRRN